MDPPLSNTKPEKSLSELWDQALKDYEGKTKRSKDELASAGDFNANSFNEILERQNAASKKFNAARHPPGTTDRIVQAVEPTLGWIVTSSAFIADHVSGTAAMPAKILSGAIAILVQAANTVSEDLNLVEQVFNDIKIAMEDAALLDNVVPNNPHFHKRLLEVFTTILDFCAFGTNLFKHHGRTRLYFGAIGGRRNQKINDKSQTVTAAIKKFKDTIPIQNLATTQEIDRQVKNMPDNIIAAIRAAKIDPALLQSLASSTDPIKNVKEKWHKHIDTSSQLESQMELIKSRFVRNSFDWLEKDDNYKQWQLGKFSPFLLVYGASGFGKTYLTYNVYQNLRQSPASKQKIIVAIQFLDSEWRLKSLICNIVIQIAEADKKFAETLERDMRNEKYAEKLNAADPDFLWERYIDQRFRQVANAFRGLYILLDGVQRSDVQDDLHALLNLFGKLDSRRHSVQVLLTGEETLIQDCSDLRMSKIKLAGNTGEDVQKVIKQRFDDSTTLKQFSAQAKNEILRQLSEKANGDMSFVDVSLSRLEQLGREKIALEELKSFRRGPEDVYKSMIKLIIDYRSTEERRIIESLFTWLTLIKKPLTVPQINYLLRLDHALGAFDVRSEINDQLRSFLFVSNSSPDQSRPNDAAKADTIEKTINADDSSQDEEAVENFQEDSDLIHFRQPSLKDFLLRGSNDLMPDLLDRQVKTFVTLCDILSDSQNRNKPVIASLQKYTIQYFGQHLRDIDISKTNENLTNDVVVKLSDILLDHNNMHDTFEHYVETVGYGWSDFELYDPPEWTEGEQPLRDLILRWGRKMRYYGHDNLQSSVATAEDWVSALDKKSYVTGTLGLGHVRSWFSKVHRDDALKAFVLAYRALSSTVYMPPKQRDYWISSKPATVENVKLVFEILEKVEKDLTQEKDSRDSSQDKIVSRKGSSIAAALILNAPDSSKETREYARELYEEALQKDSSGAERFYCLVGLAEYFYAFKKYAEAKDAATKAVAELEDELGALGTDLDDERAMKAYRLQALSQVALGESEEAIHTFKRGLDNYQHVKSSDNLILLFDDMVLALGKQMNYHGIISEVRDRPKSLRCNWMRVRAFPYWDQEFDGGETLQEIGLHEEYLRRAAYETRNQDLLIRFYEEAITYWTDKSTLASVTIQHDLALVYRDDLRVTKMSGKIYTSLLENVGNDSLCDTVMTDGIIHQLIEIYCEEFFLTDSPDQKKSTLDKLSKLLTQMAHLGRSATSSQAAGQLALARMLRSSGRLADCKRAARNAFGICITDLEDFVGYNDHDAFIVLAKCLAFVGLETDARIAGSLRLEKISNSYWDDPTTTVDETENGTMSDNGQDTAGNTQLNAPPPEAKDDKAQDGTQLVSNGPAPNASSSASDKHVDGNVRSDQQSNTASQKFIGDGSVATGSIPSNVSTDDAQPKTTSVEIDAGSSGLKHGDSEPNAAVKVAGSPEAKAQGETSKSTAPSQPLSLDTVTTSSAADATEQEDEPDKPVSNSSRALSCFGDCAHKPYYSWTPGAPSWMCLECRFVNLCDECYEVQRAHNENRGIGCWSRVCWGPHQFIRQPIEEWKGVKDGVIQRGNKKKDTKEWLSDIKKRWEKQLEKMELTPPNAGSDGYMATRK